MIKKFLENGVTCYMIQAYGQDRMNNQVRRRRILRGATFSAARKLETELNVELAQLKNGFNFAGLTYDEFLFKEFYPHVDENFPTEYDSLKATLNKWAKPALHLRLESVNPTDIKEILDHAGEELAASTVKKIRSILHRSFEFAVQGGLVSNPVASVKVDQKKCVEKDPGVLTKEEVNILLAKANIHKPTWADIWTFGIFTAMRSGEMYALLRQDIDLDNRLISVTKSFNKKIGVKSTKSGRNRRVPIADKLVPVIQKYMLGPKDEPLLPRPYEWKKGDQARVLRQFCKGIGITPIKFHDLRATAITHLFIQGASLAEVQAIVGHVDIKTTQRYLRLAGVDVAGVTNKLDFTLPSERINNVVNLF
jgi:integrase